MSALGYLAIDVDEHYHESVDSFARHPAQGVHAPWCADGEGRQAHHRVDGPAGQPLHPQPDLGSDHRAWVAQGESLLLSYVSANRDNDAFSDPFRFDITRNPNRHIAFGHGVHFCLGAALARMEISNFFAALLPRLTDIHMAGTPEHVATTFVGGLKHLPIRYQMTQ